MVGERTLVSPGWAAMTALVTPGNRDLAAGNHLRPGTPAASRGPAKVTTPGFRLDPPRQIGNGWQGMAYIG